MSACEDPGVNPAWFFPPRDGPGDKGLMIRFAKTVCHRCPDQLPCLEGAVARHERFGVWGGINFSSTRERRRIRTIFDGGPRLTPRTLWDAIDLADIPQGSWYETVHPNERYL